MILVVWILALAITCPPILGWYEPGRRALLECRYNQNEGYVVFSAMGSFFIPMAVMIYVYVRISCVVASRHDQMAEIKVHQVIYGFIFLLFATHITCYNFHITSLILYPSSPHTLSFNLK